MCVAPGLLCPVATSCCDGSTCIAIAGAQLCASNCTSGSGCLSGCCVQLTNSLQSVCVPAGNCVAPPPPETGTVLAADLSGELLIQTASGPAFFSGIGCFNVSAGSTVVFASPASACASNTITVVGSQTSCMVFCDGSGYPGVVVSSDFTSFSISTLFGVQPFAALSICTGVLPGDGVVFMRSPGACATNTFADKRSGQFCKVSCS